MLKPRWFIACVVVAVGLGFGPGRLAAAEEKTGPAKEAGQVKKVSEAKKHKIVYHFNDADPKKAIAVLTNIQNHVDVVGWDKIEALELVAHGPGLRPFMKKDMDPEVSGKLDKLLAGGLTFGACQITMQRQQIKLEELVEGIALTPSGVVRLMELQEQGYVYIKP